MVDRMEDVVRGESAVGIKNVSINEPFFQGHFPGSPVMPGVLMIEAMAQAAGILVIETLGSEMEGKLVYFMSVESARFRSPSAPETGCISMCTSDMPVVLCGVRRRMQGGRRGGGRSDLHRDDRRR